MCFWLPRSGVVVECDYDMSVAQGSTHAGRGRPGFTSTAAGEPARSPTPATVYDTSGPCCTDVGMLLADAAHAHPAEMELGHPCPPELEVRARPPPLRRRHVRRYAARRFVTGSRNCAVRSPGRSHGSRVSSVVCRAAYPRLNERAPRAAPRAASVARATRATRGASSASRSSARPAPCTGTASRQCCGASRRSCRACARM